MLAEAGADLLAFTGFAGAHWKQVWSNNSPGATERRDPTQDRCRGNLLEPTGGASAHRRRTG